MLHLLHKRTISIHALREEGDASPPLHHHRECGISIHALREEGDDSSSIRRCASGNFYPRPPRGGRPAWMKMSSGHWIISIHALREEGDPDVRREIQSRGGISIHALREEGDKASFWNLRRPVNFYPRPPRGGRRSLGTRRGFVVYNFYPRPPRGGRRASLLFYSRERTISIHALREEGDLRQLLIVEAG